MSNSTTDKAMKLLLEVAASSAELIQIWDPSVWTADLNIGGMVAIHPFQQFHHNKKEIALQNHQDVEVDNRQGHQVAPRGCGKLG